jgi:molybdopterin-guanine dinucleotide biosynthesis protein B
MGSIPVISVVAYSGTGKTTLLEKLVRELKTRGVRVAVVKHDAHDFDIDKPGKDSFRFTQAGADVVAIASDTHAAIMENRPVPFEDVVGRISGVDLIITEGYKTGDFPKIALRRAATGNDFPVPVSACVAVVSDTPVAADVPAFGLDDIAGIADFLINFINYKGETGL